MNLKTIAYFNLSDHSPGLFLDGSVVEIADLLAARQCDPRLSSEAQALLAEGVPANLDPTGVRKSRRWENLVGAIVLALTGHLPSRQDILRGRQLLQALPKELRIAESISQFSFCFLPYLLAAVKTHLRVGFQPDANAIRDVLAFVNVLVNYKQPTVTGFLCAHRANTPPGMHALIEHIDERKAQKAMNCVRGIMMNSPWTQSCKVRWYQQGPTEWASANMFPEMFLTYMTSGRIGALLGKLQCHLDEMRGIARASSTPLCAIEIFELDPITLKTIHLLRERLGDSWRMSDLRETDRGVEALVEIARERALPSVRRLMPSFSTPGYITEHERSRHLYVERNLSALSSPEHAALIPAVINRFYENQLVQPTARALYETAFYYLWGRSTAEAGGTVAIGIDRDHELFQYHAWRLGYSEVVGGMDCMPVLYARRVAKPDVNAGLNGYSVRQFWR